MSATDQELQVYGSDLYKSDPHLQHRLCEWLPTIGVDPADIKPRCVVVRRGEEHLFLASRIVRNQDGSDQIDWASYELVTEPIEVPITTPDWPRPAAVAA